jgi:hypothetical protein
MTDRLNALTIVLENDMRDDDAESLIKAIHMLRGVLSVTPNVVDFQDHVAHMRVRREMGDKLANVIWPVEKKE